MTISRDLPLAERLRLLRLAASRGVLKARSALMAPFRACEEFALRSPERLLIAPQDIRTSDPTVASEIYAGYYAFGGKIVNAHGRSPFALAPPSPEWAKTLYGFGWLRHLRAADSALARANARSLVKEFIMLLGRPRPHASWQPEVVARRTLSWLSQSPMLLEDVDYDDYRRFLAVLTRGYWLLRRQTGGGVRGELQLTAAIAMTAYSLSIQGGTSLLKRAVASLNDQLTRQVLPDGVPIGRNPQTLINLVFDLLPLRQAFAARGLSPPTELLNAIDRMTPALRMFRHGDGSLALFNGMGATAPDGVAIASTYEQMGGQPVLNARHSGFQRLEARRALVLMDTGRPPPPLYSQAAHAGCLSFEFSYGVDRIVINCGNPGPHRAAMRASARTTAAHSTLALGDASSCLFGAQAGAARFFDDEIVVGPQNVPVAREDLGQDSIVCASHDGYARRFGFIHERRLDLSANGERLEGRDRLIATRAPLPNSNYAIRFHIHPAMTLTQTWDGAGVLMTTPSGVSFVFEAGGLPLAIEESIFFAAPEGQRPCEQIVVYGASADIDEVTWTFTLQPPPN